MTVSPTTTTTTTSTSDPPLPSDSVPSALKRPRLDPGSGILKLQDGVFTTQQASYPLKLLSPHARGVRLAYMIAYGGGLVAGDHIHLDVSVSGTLVLLTQGSTKVFKHAAGVRRPQSHLLYGEDAGRGGAPRPLNTYSGGRYPEDRRGVEPEAPTSRQRMRVRVAPGSTVLLLPDSISPFKDSRYVQAQRFELVPGASCLVLDWVNSGRGRHAPAPVLRGGLHLPTPPSPAAPPTTECWEMAYYASVNEVVADGRLVARERMVLQDQPGNALRDRLRPYHVYGTLIAYGPTMGPLCALLDRVADNESQFQIPRPPGLIWSWSRLGPDGGIVRIAAVHVEDARVWLRSVLTTGGVQDIVGAALWPRCI